MGGAPDPPVGAAGIVKPATPAPPTDVATTQLPSQPDPMEGVEKTTDTVPTASKSKEVLSGSQFWGELEEFLAGKLSSQAEALSLRQTFENAWRSITATP
jgi:Get5 carboxyl domain